jgi:dihydropteroate synthase
VIAWGCRTWVMGVINITPDSFSDGGRFDRPEAAVRQASRMLAEGADVLDLGGQSTRPGALELDADQEWRRLAPALVAIRQAHPRALLSIDTFHRAVAERALAAGASWINNVRGVGDGSLLPLVASSGCPYVLMHSRGTSEAMDRLATYGNVALEVRDALLEATDQAIAAGVAPGQVIWDPGLGFAKTTAQNLALLRQLDLLVAEGYPLLIGASRKRFIGDVLDQPCPQARIWGTAAVGGQAIAKGVRILRVHDVAPMVQTARMADALWR